MSRFRTWGLCAALFLGVGACESSAPASEVVVRDSAGVRVVETTAAARFPASITMSDSPAVRIGAVEGDPGYLLSRVVGAMQLPNGEILIGNGGTNELRFYSPQGEFLRAEGREGEGPGEYEYMRGLGRCRANGFVAFDLSWQMNSYDMEGRFLEKTVLRAPDGISPYKLACDSHGHFLILGWGRAATEGPRIGFYQARDRLVLTSREGEIATDFGERLVSERIGSTGGSRPHPAGRATLFALYDDVVYVGSGESFEVELRGLDGRLTSLLRGPSISLETTDSVKAAYLDRAVTRAAPERQPAVRREVGEWEWPPRVPAYAELVVDREGTAWLRAFRIDPEEPEVWSLLDPVRGYIGDVRLQPGQTLLDVGRDHLLLLERDARDVERVVRVEVDRGSPPRAEPEPVSTRADTAADATAPEYEYLHDEAARVVAFLRGEARLEPALLADSVTLYIAPEGGGERKRVSKQELQDPAMWRVGPYDLVPPGGLTRLTMRTGRHFDCLDVPLGSRFAHLARRPHIGTKLEPPESGSCLQTWNMTFVFSDDRQEPLLTAVVYDQWEW